MKSTIFLCLALAAPVVACAGDQNKKLEDASKQEAESARERSEANIEQTKKQQVGAIEQQAERGKAQAEALPEGTQQRAKAQTEVNADRQKYVAETQARMQKIDARLAEARRKLQIAGGRAPTSTHDKLDDASRQAASLSNEVNRLPQVSAQSWTDETKRIDSRLDDVESRVKDAESKVNDALP